MMQKLDFFQKVVALQSHPQQRTGTARLFVEREIRSLAYIPDPGRTAQAFWNIVERWGIDDWLQALTQARQSRGVREIVSVERGILKTLRKKIDDNFATGSNCHFELDRVMAERNLNCVGASQILFVVGRALGFRVTPIEVSEMSDLQPMRGMNHVTCVLEISDKTQVMVDIDHAPFVSRPFQVSERFQQEGVFLVIADKQNPLELHRKIRAIGRDGLIAAVHNNRASRAGKSRRFREEIEYCNAAIRLDPQFAIAYANRGNGKAELGQWQESLDDCNRAIEIDPGLAIAYYNRAKTEQELHQFSAAIEDYDQTVRLDPTFVVAYVDRGTAKAESGQLQEAIQDCNEAIRLDPKFAPAYHNRAVIEDRLYRYTREQMETLRSSNEQAARRQAIIELSKVKGIDGDLIVSMGNHMDQPAFVNAICLCLIMKNWGDPEGIAILKMFANDSTRPDERQTRALQTVVQKIGAIRRKEEVDQFIAQMAEVWKG